MPKTIVVVPCYNEADRLDTDAFLDFADTVMNLRLLFVDDGSTDKTAEILGELNEEKNARFDYMSLPKNSGKAEAVRAGVNSALEMGPEYVGFWDADLATPLEDIPRFTAVLDSKPNVNMVFGSRIPLLGHRIERKPVRRFLGRVFANVASTLLGVPVYDTQCGAKIFRVTGELRKAFSEPFLARWIFDVEMLGRFIANRKGSNLPPVKDEIYEFALDSWVDVAGSRLKSGDFVKAISEMGQIWWRYLRPGLPNAAQPEFSLRVVSDDDFDDRQAA